MTSNALSFAVKMIFTLQCFWETQSCVSSTLQLFTPGSLKLFLAREPFNCKKNNKCVHPLQTMFSKCLAIRYWLDLQWIVAVVKKKKKKSASDAVGGETTSHSKLNSVASRELVSVLLKNERAKELISVLPPLLKRIRTNKSTLGCAAFDPAFHLWCFPGPNWTGSWKLFTHLK